ncbi:phospholipase [Peribacillus cavernae]|uniref:phospholipase D n=1 Tax=Peribacillus cavernae TaxID=1674310 RepID=A0A433HT93_9BACI|nr:phospholipase D family protein [Peribacillus cavernae]MDQ0218563.1 HKD family nuclease [Peribacillus cavernae]RUQ31553.1 phospholipase [Peribacillus cavernae]
MRKGKKKWYTRKSIYITVIALMIVSIVIVYNQYKPLPEGVSYQSKVHHVKDVQFIYDLSYKDNNEKIIHERRIFNEINKAIEDAESYLVIDMFLFNGYYDEKANFPNISENLTQKIIEQKKKKPNLEAIFITDEVNTTYQSYKSKEIEKLKKNGVKVVVTNLDRLRDPNPLYSGVYRTFFQWFGENGDGWIRNPMAKEAPKVTFRSYLRLLNIKANHRKLLATEKTAIVSSANPHDASGFHSNIAFQMEGNIIGDLIKAEEAVGEFSKGPGEFPDYREKTEQKGPIDVQFLTEGKINKHMLKTISETKKGDQIWLGMFYIADRHAVNELTEAAKRGVKINMVLDPNQNAFGTEKMGLPNLPVAAEFHELGEENIHIRWYKTEKEQFHTKLLFIQKPGKDVILGGSANYTARNLDDYNLEANVEIHAPDSAQVTKDVEAYFNRIWTNKDGTYTADYKEYQDKLPAFKYGLYRIQKLFRFTTY